jgi:hypothetical protein
VARTPLTGTDMMRHLAKPVRASRAKKFDVLDKRPPLVRRPRDEAELELFKRSLAEHGAHKRHMFELLVEKYHINLRDPQAAENLLFYVLHDYVPAFATYGLRPKVGRPRTAISDGQRRAIDCAVAAGQSVRSACLKLIKGRDRKRRADALSAAYRRTTK